ncbi:DUF2892 domain-containing protein [Natronorubrum sp. JWXQ-INN-674]|uniref:DUF2892 domain-containing protein n=1 Tax=Natronorubrum halalkaliphilum TaxID=2691917 RepID=A0A6B0VL08_9EURY|nr:SRPBCC family protein [Natronorubrum halalkaliphilum]MXV61249.1 DUF2892 domain-containing protein [Natronorubrum halalkaliphilum]
MTSRSQQSIDESPEAVTVSDRAGSGTNIGPRERAASVVLGIVLLFRGLRRRSLGGVATAAAGGALLSRGVRGRSRLYRLLGVNTAAGDERPDAESTDAPSIERTITVGKPADELAAFCREPEQFNQIVGEFADVSETTGNEGRLSWHIDGPLGQEIEWETELVEERPGELLRWASVDGATVPHEATVRFQPAPGDRGTQVTLRIQSDPPGGSLGNAALERLGVVPSALAGTALDRFKSLAETGEIPTIDANPSGRGKGDLI